MESNYEVRIEYDEDSNNSSCIVLTLTKEQYFNLFDILVDQTGIKLTILPN